MDLPATRRFLIGREPLKHLVVVVRSCHGAFLRRSGGMVVTLAGGGCPSDGVGGRTRSIIAQRSLLSSGCSRNGKKFET
ncbi:hypothetical protein DY000_02042306 [Brassica cretica]|uniref:Uncharacterized protein n=1 Tax=Brassica cretica TaxID=69181 RepID=A0ABQ7BLY1_BRACR|nr:hypothetical protein DY000_02042306 [Brassica cretica]